MTVIATWSELTKEYGALDTSKWTYDCIGENFGSFNAVITGYVIRPRTDEEQAQWQADHAGLVAADLDSHTPLNGGRS